MSIVTTLDDAMVHLAAALELIETQDTPHTVGTWDKVADLINELQELKELAQEEERHG